MIELLFGLPYSSAVIIVGVLMVRDLLRRGECGPFLSGFLVSGVGAMVLVSGFLNNMISMITGRYKIGENRHEA